MTESWMTGSWKAKLHHHCKPRVAAHFCGFSILTLQEPWLLNQKLRRNLFSYDRCLHAGRRSSSLSLSSSSSSRLRAPRGDFAAVDRLQKERRRAAVGPSPPDSKRSLARHHIPQRGAQSRHAISRGVAPSCGNRDRNCPWFTCCTAAEEDFEIGPTILTSRTSPSRAWFW